MPGRIIVTVLVVFLVFFGGFSAQAGEKITASAVVILPFDANAAGKYAYLKESLRNMLTTRLAVKDGIRVLDASLSPKEAAEIKGWKKQELPAVLFARLHADYIVTGEISEAANGLNIQLIFHPALGAKKSLKFAMSAATEENILPSLDRLALEIGDKIAPLKTETVLKEESPQQQIAGVSGAMTAFRTPHPERLYKTGLYGTGGVVGGENNGMLVSSQGVRRSAPLSMKMIAMAVGDLDGDGMLEILLAEDGDLRIFHFQEGRFSQIAKVPIAADLKIHAMNVADLEKNGHMDIYISATEGNRPSSCVASWSKEHGLQMLHKNIPWYIRPMDIPGEGMVLVGQEKGFDDKLLVVPGIYEVALERGRDIPKRGKKLLLPKSVNLFDFAMADLNGDGKIETLVIDGSEKLSVYDQAGTQLWVSKENFGGSTNYIGPAWINQVLADTKIFVPTRIIVSDMNHDNKKEVVIGRNQRGSYSYNFFKNSRWYDGGSVSGLIWTGSAMVEVWHTNTLDGMIADYSMQAGAIKKTSGSGVGMSSSTLFVGQIPDSSFIDKMIPNSSETNVYAYVIDILNKKLENKN